MFKTAVQALKEEFREARDELRNHQLITADGFAERAIQEYPEFNCPEGFNVIRSVWNGYTANLYLTRTIEKMKNELIPPTE